MAQAGRTGDIVEIPTPEGVAYAQVTHVHPEYGPLLRVFPGTFEHRPPDFAAELEGAEPQFSVFFPLQAAVNRHIVSLVANLPVPGGLQAFPTFRAGVVNPASGRVETWWLWDGETEWRVNSLTPEQRRFPVRGIGNDTLLVERILSGWTAEAWGT